MDWDRYITPYLQMDHFESEDGFIVWRTGTGLNTELLHIRSRMPGGGERLLRAMLTRLKENPPYATVFGFCLFGNSKAHEFYRNMGFLLTPVSGVYDDGQAVVFSQRYDTLCEKHLRWC